jgi:hypothetical protein
MSHVSVTWYSITGMTISIFLPTSVLQLTDLAEPIFISTKKITDDAPVAPGDRNDEI